VNESSVDRYRRHIAESREADRAAYDRIMSGAKCDPSRVLYCATCGIGTVALRDAQRASFTR
jgi:hypothetical protein